MIHLEHLGPAFRLLWIRSGLMQKHVSEQTSMSRSQVSRYERGHDTPNLVTLGKYLDTVNADLGDLQRAMLETETGAIRQIAELCVCELMRPIIDEALRPPIDETIRPVVGELLREHLDRSDDGRKETLGAGWIAVDVGEDLEDLDFDEICVED